MSLVQCSTCNAVFGWKSLRSQKIMGHVQETLEDKEDIGKWVYTCITCVLQEYDCSEQEANSYMLEDRQTPAWARQRSERYRQTLAVSRGYTRA